MARLSPLLLVLICACASLPPRAADCPPGTQRYGAAPPAGDELWCATAAGERNGPAQSWDDTGGWTEAEYRGGLVVGPFVSRFPDGAKEFEGRFGADGREQGSWRHWWPDGKLRAEWTMQEGRQHGPLRAWYASGAPRVEGELQTGLAHGRWLFFDEAGQLERRVVYERGEEVATEDLARGSR